MRINTNIASMTAQEAASNVNKALNSSLEKLSSGLRINKASDDASGMAIADKLRTQASALGQAISNANSGNALVQIADKAMAEQSNILDIVKTKLIQAATQTTSTEGRAAVNADIKKLLTQFDKIGNETNYNGISLLDAAKTFTFQVGENQAYDITATTAKASLTNALGGSSGSAVGSIAAGASVSLKETSPNTAIVLTTPAAATAVSGNVQTLKAVPNAGFEVRFTGQDAATRTVLDAIVEADGTVMSKSGSGETAIYTLESGKTAAINGANINIKLLGTVGTIEIGTDSIVNVTNGSSSTALTTSGGTGSGNLGTIKNTSTLTAESASSFMSIVDLSLNELNTNRSEFGSTQNQLDSFIRNAMTTQTNIKAAESVIRDVDYAAESANFNKQNIIAQAGTYALSQANTIQQNVLRLLQ